MPRRLSRDRLTPVRAHRLRCLECQGDSHKAIRECASENCPSWPYRFGHDPSRKGLRHRASYKSKPVTERDSTQENTTPG